MADEDVVKRLLECARSLSHQFPDEIVVGVLDVLAEGETRDRHDDRLFVGALVDHGDAGHAAVVDTVATPFDGGAKDVVGVFLPRFEIDLSSAVSSPRRRSRRDGILRY